MKMMFVPIDSAYAAATEAKIMFLDGTYVTGIPLPIMEEKKHVAPAIHAS